MQLLCPRDQRPGNLDNIHCAAGEPRSFQHSQKAFFDDERSYASRISKHFVETDSHCIDGGFRQRDHRGRCQGSGIQQSAVSERGSIVDD